MHNNNNINNEMFDLNYIINNNYYERINILNFLKYLLYDLHYQTFYFRIFL